MFSNSKLRPLFLFGALALSVFLGISNARAETGKARPDDSKEVVDMVLASVDGDPFTMSDLRRYIEAHGETAPKDLLDGSPVVRRYLREMVVDDVIQREAGAAGLSVGDDEIEAYIEEIRRQNSVDEAGFLKLLSGKGMTLESYEKQVRTDILKTRLLSSRVRAKVNVLDTDVAKHLSGGEDPKAESGDPRLEEIVVPYDAEDPIAHDKAVAEAEDLIAKVADGKSFSEVGGDNYSDLGYVKPEDLIEPLQSAAKKLDVGETSGVLSAGKGKLIILRSAGVGEKKAIDKDEMERVRKELFEKAFKDEAEKYLNDELPKKYHVELKL